MADYKSPSPNNTLPPPHTPSPNISSPPDQDELSEYRNIENFEFCPISVSDFENLEKLIKEETNFPILNKNEKAWFKSARLDVVKWILDTTKSHGLQYSTAYLALMYFDRFYSITTIEEGDFHGVDIASVACLSLAAKMENASLLKASALPKHGVFNKQGLEVKTLQKMELLVANTLEWKMNIVTPFAYVNYFVSNLFGIIWCEEEVIKQAEELISTVVVEINAAEQRPSIVAAAAVLAAYDHELTKVALELKVMLELPFWGTFEKGQLFYCYKLMQGIVVSKKLNKNRG